MTPADVNGSGRPLADTAIQGEQAQPRLHAARSVGQLVTETRVYLTEVEGQRTSNNVLVEDAIVAYSQQLLADRGLDGWPPVS